MGFGIRCLLIGDAFVGKTSMLLSYRDGLKPDDLPPTISDIHRINMKIDDDTCLSRFFFDLGGSETTYGFRPFIYEKAEIIILCFSTVSRNSYKNIKSMWYNEIKKYCSNVPILLVGTKIDLRDDAKNQNNESILSECVSQDEGYQLMKKIGAIKYIECSAVTREGLKKIFEDMVINIIRNRSKKGQQNAICALI